MSDEEAQVVTLPQDPNEMLQTMIKLMTETGTELAPVKVLEAAHDLICYWLMDYDLRNNDERGSMPTEEETAARDAAKKRLH